MWWCLRVLAAAALAAASAGVPDAAAADVTWSASVTGRAEHLSNPLLSVSAPSPASRRTLRLDADVAARSEAWDLTAQADYADNHSTIPSLALDAYGGSILATRRYETGSFVLSASLRRESTLTSELAATGTAFALAQRETRSVAPTWQHRFTERLTSSVGASWQQAEYSPRRTSLVNFTSTGLNAGLTYFVDPRLQAQLNGSVSRFQTDPFTSASLTKSMTAGLTYEAGDRLTLSAGFGPSRTHTRTASFARICPLPQIFCDVGLVPFLVTPAEARTVSTGDTWNLAATWQATPETTLSLIASRAVLPSGGGSLVDSETRSAALSHRFTDRVSGSASLAQTRSGTVLQGAAAGLRSRSAIARMSWQLDERVFLDAGAEWRESQVPAGGAPSSTTLYVALRYALQRRPLPRRRRTATRPSSPEPSSQAAPGTGV